MKKAFTLVEVLLVIGIIISASIILVPVSVNQLRQEELGSVGKKITSTVFSAQQSAYTRKENQSYGVHFDLNSNTYTIFRGNNFASASDTQTYEFPDNIYYDEIDFPSEEIIFEQGSFRPSVGGQITLSDDINTIQIIVNQEGLIYYEVL